ncbi:MAG: YihY/virulence factor BrkB family protein [Thermodesulfobacteriota bacterium]
MRLSAKEIWELLKETYGEWNQDNAPLLGAALAFYTIFSLAPVFIIIMAIVGYFLGKEAVQVHLINRLADFVGKDNATNIIMMAQDSYRHSSGKVATLIALLFMLIGSTTVFVVLKNALNNMWGVRNHHTKFLDIFKDRGISFLIVLLCGVILFISMIFSSTLAVLNNWLEGFFTVPIYFFQVTDYIFSLIILTLIFAILYKFLPDVEISWKDVMIGALITALLFILGKFFVGLYLSRKHVSLAYGAAGSLVVILLWVYYSAQIVFIGAEFTQVYARKYGTAIKPKHPGATTAS